MAVLSRRGCSPNGAVLLALVLACLGAALAYEVPYTGFIRVAGGKFADATCREFLFSGWNGWSILEAAANKITPPGYKSGKEYITYMFNHAHDSHKLNIMRFFLAGDDNYRIVLMEKPGKFNEEAFQGLDFILDEARKANVYLTLVPLNLWKRNNGVPQFEEWCGTDKNGTDANNNIVSGDVKIQTPYTWLKTPACRQIYKDYLTGIANRVNSINGIAYKDDPTIFSWNLINEPRCKYCGIEPLNDWIDDIAAHLKSVDPNHMVTTGEEGFFDQSSPFAVHNPGNAGGWASNTGQDFVSNHASPNIDYSVIHMWPDNWVDTDFNFGKEWIQAHIEAAKTLGKPLVLEEYGKNAKESDIKSVRDPWFKMAHGILDENLANDGPLRGILFWEWDSDGTGPRDGKDSTVRDYDSTMKDVIVPASHKIADSADQLHRSAGPDVAGCIPLAVQMSGPSSSTAGVSRAAAAVPAVEDFVNLANITRPGASRAAAVPAVEDATNLARKLML